jgi:hypothetical protein
LTKFCCGFPKNDNDDADFFYKLCEFSTVFPPKMPRAGGSYSDFDGLRFKAPSFDVSKIDFIPNYLLSVVPLRD